MIHKFTKTCEQFFKMCEEPIENSENKLQSLYHLLAKLNYTYLKIDNSKHYNKNAQNEIQKRQRITKNEARPIICKNFPELGFYWSILNTNEMDNTPQYGTGDAIDDILDIYQEIKKGYEYYQDGNLKEAIESWEKNYKYHWGKHLVDLQKVLYDIIY
jgi:hypothetical protein